jgi:hypothetical protein
MRVCSLLSILLFYAFVMRVDDMTKNGWMTLLCLASKTLRIFFSGSGYGSSCPAANKFLYLNISPKIEAR